MKEHERLLYQSNKLSQTFIMLYILGNTIITIVYANNMNVVAQLGMAVMLNIALTLFAFLMAVQQASYSIQWGYAGVVMGLFQIARILWMPDEITGTLRMLTVVLFLVTGVLALIGSFQCILRSRERANYIVENNIDLATLQK